MKRMLTQEEFEFQTMCGSTNDAFIFGVGSAQWQPTVSASSCPNTMGNIFADNAWYSSIYLMPKNELDISTNSEEYRKAVANEIKNTITDGNTIWDPISGYAKELSGNGSVDIQLDESDMVTVTVRDGGKRYDTTVPLEQMLSAFENPKVKPLPKDSMPNVTYNAESGIEIKQENKNFDYAKFSREARKWSGRVITIQKPFQLAADRMTLYSKTIRPGGTSRVFPFDYRYPKWIRGGRSIVPSLGGLGIDLSNSTIITASKYLKWLGKGVGAAGVIIGGIDIYKNDLNWSNGLYTGMATLALFPETAPIAICYFIVDTVLEISTDKGIGNYIEDSLKGKTMAKQAMTLLQYSNLVGTICNIYEIIQIERKIQ